MWSESLLSPLPWQGRLELTDEDVARLSKAGWGQYGQFMCQQWWVDEADGMQLSDEELAKYIGTESQRMSKACVSLLNLRALKIGVLPHQAAYRKRAHDQVYHGKPTDQLGKTQRTSCSRHSWPRSEKLTLKLRNQNFSAVVPAEEPPLPASGWIFFFGGGFCCKPCLPFQLPTTPPLRLPQALTLLRRHLPQLFSSVAQTLR